MATGRISRCQFSLGRLAGYRAPFYQKPNKTRYILGLASQTPRFQRARALKNVPPNLYIDGARFGLGLPMDYDHVMYYILKGLDALSINFLDTLTLLPVLYASDYYLSNILIYQEQGICNVPGFSHAETALCHTDHKHLSCRPARKWINSSAEA
jgi:hypothetical protein